MIGWAVTAYILFTLACVAAFSAIVLAVESDTYARWWTRRQKQEQARRAQFLRTQFYEFNRD